MRLALTGAALALVTGCAGLPVLRPVADPAEASLATTACLSAFPTGKWRAVHSVDASMPFGNNSLLLGVTAVDDDGVRSILMSPEGVALFDAVSGRQGLQVRRAVPPLDHGGFAEGLADDVVHLFVPPAGSATAVGLDNSGNRTCRWHDTETAKTTDIVLNQWTPAWIRNYSGGSLIREIHAEGPLGGGWYSLLVLRTTGIGSYTLRMRLVSHEQASDQATAIPGPDAQQAK